MLLLMNVQLNEETARQPRYCDTQNTFTLILFTSDLLTDTQSHNL